MKTPAQFAADVSDVGGVPDPIPACEWADENFYLSSESSNTSGRWRTTAIQRAILNAMGSDAIEKVDFFKPTRFGGTKMDIAALFYFVAHKRRNGCFYQPTATDSDEFVKSEIQPAIRDCEAVRSLLISDTDKHSQNTLSFKGFRGCNTYYKGGHSPSSYERMTLDFVILDELDLFKSSVGMDKGGSPTTLAWGRVRNSLFKKQIQTSKPTFAGVSLIEKSASAAADILVYQAKCPECEGFYPIEWGGPDTPHGFKWDERDPSTVRHFCSGCGAAWENGKLHSALEPGYWEGPKGYKTYDGLEWTRNGESCPAPRHIAFATWSGYSTFIPWSQIVEEWYDAQGDIEKIRTFTNNVLGRTWNIQHAGTMTAEAIKGIPRTEDVSEIIAVTAGIDVQDDRLEVQYVGHDKRGNIYILGYEIYRGDMSEPEVYKTMAQEVYEARFETGVRELPVLVACIDTQGHHTTTVHEFLHDNRKLNLFVGINGVGTASYEIAEKPSYSKANKEWIFYSVGVNVLKQKVLSAVRSYDQETSAFRIWDEARLPKDYGDQLSAERMEIKRVSGVERIVFTNPGQKRNEALDTLVYALAGKAYIRTHKGRVGRNMFG